MRLCFTAVFTPHHAEEAETERQAVDGRRGATTGGC